MIPEQISVQDGYEMRCGARELDTGKFEPTLVITRQVWPTRARVIAVARGDHAEAATAIDAARDAGRLWMANYGVSGR
ncbi:MAG: hypothetical protein RL722_1459 [Pseudomonadota bacterium]|jgi:hypothetical protein